MKVVSSGVRLIQERRGSAPFYGYVVTLAPSLRAAAAFYRGQGNGQAARSCERVGRNTAAFCVRQWWRKTGTRKDLIVVTLTFLGMKKPNARTIAHECTHGTYTLACHYRRPSQRKKPLRIEPIYSGGPAYWRWWARRFNAKGAGYWNEGGFASCVGNMVAHVTDEVDGLWPKTRRRR